MFHRLWRNRFFVVTVVLVWKVALLTFTAQPVPANDAFWYDSPVVHLLNHGGYYSPSLLPGHPISGAEFYCAYPPLHQVFLLGWMTIWGTSALAAMWFHLVLLGICFLTVCATLHLLSVPSSSINIACLFLFGLTFHDRPDTLACVIGIGAFWAACRWLVSDSEAAPKWAWVSSFLLVLNFTTSIQMGVVFGTAVFSLYLLGWIIKRRRLPAISMTLSVLLTWTLLAIVIFVFPHYWSGFLEEGIRQNASVGGLHLPSVNGILKTGRSIPGTILIAIWVIFTKAGQRLAKGFLLWSPTEIIMCAGLFASLLLAIAGLVLVSPNWIIGAVVFQPVLVGLFLSRFEVYAPTHSQSLLLKAACFAAVVLVSIRAVGMSTWGVVLAFDHGYKESLNEIRKEISPLQERDYVIVSANFGYETDRHNNAKWIHVDAPWETLQETYPQALRRLRVRMLILSQFDYYRRYQYILAELKNSGEAELTVRDTSRLPSPEHYPAIERVVQYISWAPVFVDVKWN